MKKILLACFFASVFATPLVAGAATVSNKDVLDMLSAGMPDEVIIQAINAGEPKFDTSSGALIKLKSKGASPEVLKAVLGAKPGDGPRNGGERAEKPGGKTNAKTSGGNRGTRSPEEVALVVDGKESPMQYLIPGMRTAARALGFGGVASYAVLQGDRAQLRLRNPSPAFIVSVPKNAQVPNYVTLASLATRKNGNREVITGGGYMSYSSGIHKDRVVAISAEKMEDQSRAQDGFVLYLLRPENGLAPGEYALVLYTAEVRVVGFFGQAGNSFFDFGIDAD